MTNKSFQNIFQGFSEFDLADKRHLLNFIRPVNINFTTGDLSLEFNNGLSRILSKRETEKLIKMHINYKNISIERVIVLLAKNGIHIDDSEAIMILEFLNLISKTIKTFA